jgi:hypothetical protein
MRCSVGRGRVSVVATAVLLAGVLAGCSGLRAGQAAVVGDESISQSKFDETSSKFCTFLETFQTAQGVPDPAISARIASLVSLDYLVRGTAAEQLAEREGIEIDPSEVKRYTDAVGVPAEAAPPDQRQDVTDITEMVARLGVITDQLGSDAEGNQTEAGNDQIMEYLNEVGYEIEPRYGNPFAGQREEDPGTGSLSIAVSDEGKRSMTILQGGTPSDAERCS